MNMSGKDCPACSAPATRESALVPAARHPALRGSRFVGSRGVRDLFVCRECDSLWQTWYDQREGYQCWRSSGPTILPVFAADTSLSRLVEWAAARYSEGSFGLVDALATILIRRRPEGLNRGVAALLRGMGEISPPADEASAERLRMLFHLLALAAERAVRGDLRPKGPRVKPPPRYHEAEALAAAERFRTREVDGLTRLPLTHDVLRRLLWESRRGPGPVSPERAVIAIHDPSPFLLFLEKLPLTVVRRGVLRGICAEAAFKAGRKLNDLGRLPENDHAIWLPEDGWRALDRLVDPLERLAASWWRICESAKHPAAERLARLQMETLLVREPIRMGARFTDRARSTLEKLEERYRLRSAVDSSQSLAALHEILELERRGLEADGRCVLTRKR